MAARYTSTRWGEVEELAPVDLESARRARLAVRISDLDDDAVEAEVREKRARIEMVRRYQAKRWVSSYCVLLWV